jgi:endonuclease/exonuclease/phosphatase family metal-dependent hydrolase
MCDLRVMTFNIRGGVHQDGENAWPHRAALNVATIARHAPDLIGFQELQRSNEEVYDARLTGYRHELGPKAEFGEPHNYNAIYWRPERLDPVAAGGFWLSETPERYSASWETRCLRAANWVRFRCLEDGAEFLHLNTHLDHVSELARVEGSKLVLRQLDELAGDRLPVILTADFNSNPGSTVYQLYRDGGFVDAYLAAGHGDGRDSNTFHGFEGVDYAPERHYHSDRIDWLFTRDSRDAAWRFCVRSCAIVRDAAPPLYPSDHYPVLAELRLDSSGADALAVEG